MPRNTTPHVKREVGADELGGDDTQPTDRRLGIPEVDRCALPKIPVEPHFDEPEAALKMGGRGKRGETESYAEERAEGEA